MTDTDVALHFVHLVAFAVDAVPAIKASRFEVSLHFVLFGLDLRQQ